jgi:hypothetical protein
MGKLYWVVVVAVIVSGLTAVLYFGLEGKSVPLITWSHFSDAKEVSDAVKTRMTQEFQPYDIYFLGPQPQIEMHVQAAINLANWLKEKSPAVLVVDTLMSERIPAIHDLHADVTLDLAREQERFLEGLKNLSPGQKVIVIAPDIYVTHYLAQSPVSQMHEILKDKKYIVLSFFDFPHSREEEKDAEFPCQTSESSAGQLDLGCFILSQARPVYLKNSVPNKVPGFLNLVRANEYMFFLKKP